MHITLRRLKVWILLIFPMPSNKNRILADSANLWPGDLLPNYRLNDKYAPKSYQDFFFRWASEICYCGTKGENMTVFDKDSKKWCCKETIEECTNDSHARQFTI